MANRLTDTEKWKKKWIRKLDPKYKLFWVYLLDQMNHAGIWDVDMELASFQLGWEYDEEEILKVFNQKIIPFKNGTKWFIPKFIEFQYKGQLNPQNRTHQSVISILEKYKLINKNKPLASPLQGAKDKDKDKDKEILYKEYYNIVRWYQSEVVKHFPNKSSSDKSTIDAGLDAIDKLIRIDGYSFEDVKRTLQWVVSSYDPSANFNWLPNLLSLASLRKRRKGEVTKFEKIFTQLPAKPKKYFYIYACPNGCKKDIGRKSTHIVHSICTVCRAERELVRKEVA